MTVTELGALPKLISLPREPVSATWEVDEGRQSGTLRALLRFSAADYDAIVKESETFDRRDNELLAAGDYEWLGAATQGIDAVRRGEQVELIGVEPRRANLFARAPLSPYVNGKITPLRDGFVFVSMFAM